MPLLREDLLTPIPGENPSGQNLYYDPLYDKIKQARFEEEDTGLQGDWSHSLKRADYNVVTKLAGDALAKQSKDLQLIAWFGEAALNQQKFAALPEILKLFRDTQEQFWDTCYPELDEGSAEFRATPQEWFASRCDHILRRLPLTKKGLTYLDFQVSKTVPTEEDAGSSDAKATARQEAISDGKLTQEEWNEAVAATPLQFYEDIEQALTAALDEVQKLQEFCEAKYGDYYPNFGKLRSVAEELQHTVHQLVLAKGGGEAAVEEVPAEEAAGTEETYEEAGSSGKRVVAKLRMKLGEPASPEDAAANIAAMADWLRRQDGNQVAPYLIVRALRWGELRSQGESPDFTFLVPPASEVRQNLKLLYTNGDYENLLHEAENAAGSLCGRAWLDLARYAAQACESLGYSYAARAIVSETRALLQDYPELPNWSFADDTPTANNDTKTWIQEQVLAGMATSGAGAQGEQPYEAYEPPAAAPSSEETSSSAPNFFEQAIELARGGQIAEALEGLAQEAASARSGRQRFRSQLHVAQVFLTGDAPTMALPILQDLVGQLESRALFDWEEPSFVADTLTAYIQCINHTTKDEQERNRVYGLLCRIHPAAALQVSRRR